MGTITIDGRTFEGNSVVIRGDGTVIIDGKLQDEPLTGVVEVKVIEGVLGRLECYASVTCGDVHGNVSAGGSVNCDDVGGNISAGGSVNADSVSGPINAGGSVLVG